MKLQIALVAFIAAFVHQTVAQNAPTSTASLTRQQILERVRQILLSRRRPQTPSKPATPTVSRDYYPAGANDQTHLLRARQKIESRKEQESKEMALFHRLEALPAEKKRQLYTKFPQLRNRMEYLKQVAARKQQQTGTGSTGGQNTVLSGANRVRPTGKSANTASSPSTRSRGLSPSQARGLARVLRRIQALRNAARRKTTTHPFLQYQSVQSKRSKAIAAGCTNPMMGESLVESMMMFGAGGCAVNGAVCYMNAQSCVEIGKDRMKSIMCCPPGYSSGTIGLFHQMKQMQQMMNMFQ